MKFICLGDSLMHFNSYSTYPQTGWVQELNRYLKDPIEVPILDFALNGRSTKSFIDEGQFNKALSYVQKGDVVLISFGHNDEKSNDPSRYCPPFGSYQDNLRMFYHEIINKGGEVIFISSIERLLYSEDGKLTHSHGSYIQAMEEVSKELGAEFINLNAITYDFYSKRSFKENRKYVMTLEKGEWENYLQGQEDTTHLTMVGAMNVCSLVVKEFKKIDLVKDLFL